MTDVRRLRSGRARRPRGELLVTFCDVDTRDRIASYARNLGGHVDKEGKPTAGVRPDIPSFLGGVHRALLQYGFDMKKKYGNGFRRNIRFEDADHSFVIDLLIPGPNNHNNEWVTVGYNRVLADRKRRAQAAGKNPDEMLSSTTAGSDKNDNNTNGSAIANLGPGGNFGMAPGSGPSAPGREQGHQQQAAAAGQSNLHPKTSSQSWNNYG